MIRLIRDWLFSVPTLVAFALTLIFFEIAGRVALLFGPKAFDRTMASLQRTLLRVVRIAGVRFDIERSDALKASGGYIFISNHQSMFDIPIFGGILSKNYPKYVSKRSLARGIPAISLNLAKGGHALIDRGDRSQAVAVIEEMARSCEERDVSPVIFPEGTRSRDGSLGPYKTGGVAGLMTGAPGLEIVPAVIDGLWKVSANNMFPIPFGTRVRVRFGDPIARTADEDPADIAQRCRAWAQDVLNEWHEHSESAT